MFESMELSPKLNLSSFQGGKKQKKLKVGVADQITTITSSKKLILTIFSQNLRYTCFWSS